jgi:hypothetical protein
MFTLTHEGQYLTAQGTRPYLTTNPRCALVFHSEHEADTARKTLEPIMGIELDVEGDEFKCRNGLPFNNCKCC